MKPILLLIFFLALSAQLTAQDSVAKAEPYWATKFSAGPGVYGYTPISLYAAIERRNPSWGYQLQIGTILPRSYAISDTIDNIILEGSSYWWTARAEVRKYKTLREKKLLPGKRERYIGAELFANVYRGSRKDEYYLPGTNSYVDAYEDALVLNKKMLGIGFVFGFQRFIGNRFMLGFHTGLGVKFKFTTAEHNLHNEARSTYVHGMFINYADQVGFSVAMAMPLNIYIGYKL